MNLTAQGYVSLLLHAHLPYVRHLDRDDYMEERWFYEAMTETYLPLIDLFGRLTRDGIPFRLTMSMSPTLLAMMEDPLMQNRYEAHLRKLIRLAEMEIERNADEASILPVAAMYYEKLSHYASLYRDCGRDIIAPFREYQDAGALEIIACAATHAFLPLLKHPESIEAQIALGAAEYERHFRRKPIGIWLPECGYTREISAILHKYGIRYFIADHHALEHARPQPKRGMNSPVMTQEGVHVFARDPESSRQVWSSREGYPGDPDYREYYRDIGFDLGWRDAEEWEYIKPFLLSDGQRIHTGLKYYRVTGDSQPKQPYVEHRARRKAETHARHFLECRERQIGSGTSSLDRKPIVLCPYDAELFGHWWYEGPLWIEALFRELERRPYTVAMVSPSDYLRIYPESETADIPFSSWGRGGYAEVWLQEDNDWIYRHLHRAEERLGQTASRRRNELWGYPETAERILNQAVRELMLAQSSDWAFIIDSKTVPSYAVKRTSLHIANVHRLLDMIDSGIYEQEALEEMERAFPCFPAADYRMYLPEELRQDGDEAGILRPPSFGKGPAAIVSDPGDEGMTAPRSAVLRKTVLMLAWEFPPLIVGGLARAVYDLSRHLVSEHADVHVITRDTPEAPAYETMEGIHVHRVRILQTATDIDFMDWVFQLNAAIADCAMELIAQGCRFDFIHAHDWLVYYAAADLKGATGLPLIATIHATEHGRNHGNIHTDIQRRIHELERQLAEEADRVIVCSQAMVKEIMELFALPRHKLTLIPNGVDAGAVADAADSASFRLRYAQPHERLLFYVGRLVYEKGVHVLIEAMPAILQHCPETKLVIAGTGPMKRELVDLAGRLGLERHIIFTGFILDDERNGLLQAADVCVFPSLYEPFGIVALEAMQSGTPVVVSDTGGFAELIEHGVDGFKALPGHRESLAWHITEMLLNGERAASMAAAAQRKVKRSYHWQSIAVTTRQVYEGVMTR
ncbi:D-inositol-3-phosphate glycosyltransferase [Paenibacillus sp. CECT 9249]|uniref:1,4-alpha-glucan branching protein domain-containing protein n=1 Tax=Paenibacillus sp. CECT 9249 TaxID=2845385 RepID=UPI001E61C70A|nr:1,4-alpha-glucan branching protein domain-containing protein [Paenibacillus sp. CECT 9249]CAH0117937.1 D-inositol-3-phosphate glycosyltransferase [Paenibacillus sp. CECT 9249]